MDWKKIAPWNWFKHEQASAPVASTPARLGSELERIFEETFRRSFPGTSFPGVAGHEFLKPTMDISEGRKAYTVQAELPGVELADLSIEVEGQTLTIRAEKRQESEEDEEGYHCVERSYGAVQRVLSIPDDGDGEAIDARFRNGVLKLRIPKRAASALQGHRIEVRAD